MSDTAKLAELLHEAALKYPIVCRIVDGDEADWPCWHANWLPDLADALAAADRYAHAGPAWRWEDVYAREPAARFGA